MRKSIKFFRQIIVFIKYIIFSLFTFNRKSNIWLISERGNDARDNAYHFFKYVNEKHPEIDIRFIISSNSSDYNKVSQIGKTVEFGSNEHYKLLLKAKVLISTHPLGFTPDKSLFTRLQEKGLYKTSAKVIHLKHGITKDKLDFSGLKFDLFVCGASPEYDFIVREFDYLRNCAKYTGFARYDNLTPIDNDKLILVMPTFRKWLNYYSDSKFCESSYYKYYNNLLNDKTIIKYLEKYGYKLIFYPHYQFQNRLKLFSSCSKNVILASFNDYDVQDLLRRCKLLVTDYSSVFFDFAYMNKPIIYFQFDFEDYRSKHYKEGYFNYEHDGFGPVLYDLNSLIKEICDELSINCKMNNYYSKRVASFYKYRDKKNCERIFNEISKVIDCE